MGTVIEFPEQSSTVDELLANCAEVGLETAIVAGYTGDGEGFYMSGSDNLEVRDLAALHRQTGIILDGLLDDE